MKYLNDIGAWSIDFKKSYIFHIQPPVDCIYQGNLVFDIKTPFWVVYFRVHPTM